ncbi:UDP-3-O-[3-hydroxymyristoyl] N-acetylglucosamine deacetylase [Pelagibacterales bacterium SAG-MED28]|nr:UDP-3-O-[3-hydroxymyristoyl] N-acetylglucosamine deacetylase [Pelagibacterales bacterium SAG-MED28]|tara:strand:- start:1725 stop:2651 length:927 start_codon:yes stop_codon:yes gene_type:complete
MNEVYQKTLSQKISFKGIGLHSGKSSTINLHPAKEDAGIVFKRVDLANNNLIKACFANVCSAKLCTTLKNDHNVKVSTVEHLLAALYITGVDNALIEINNEEVPIMDGSSKDFIKVLERTELVNQKKKRKYLKISDKIELIDGEREISIQPNSSSLDVYFQLNYKNEIIGKQQNAIDFQKDNLTEVFSSRTFCLFEDIEKIKKNGLAKGGSLENALVVDNDKILNEGGLRNEREFVNHKILDLAGDFLLSGHRILGKVNCYQGGHELTNLLLRKIFSKKSNFQIIELQDIEVSKKFHSKELEKIAVNA